MLLEYLRALAKSILQAWRHGSGTVSVRRVWATLLDARSVGAAIFEGILHVGALKWRKVIEVLPGFIIVIYSTFPEAQALVWASVTWALHTARQRRIFIHEVPDLAPRSLHLLRYGNILSFKALVEIDQAALAFWFDIDLLLQHVILHLFSIHVQILSWGFNWLPYLECRFCPDLTRVVNCHLVLLNLVHLIQ